MTEAKFVHVFFYARANGYFPVDQLIDAVRLINSPYYTFVFDKYGIYSLSIDYNSSNSYYWQATRNVFEFSSYKISRSLAIFVPRDAVEMWLTLLEKENISRDVEIYLVLTRDINDEEVLVFSIWRPNEAAYSVASHSMLICNKYENIHNLIGLPTLRRHAYARVESDALKEILAELRTKNAKAVQLIFHDGKLQIGTPDNDHYVLNAWRHEGKGEAHYPADRFIKMAEVIAKYTSYVDFEFEKTGWLQIEAGYVPGAISFMLPPLRRHEPYSTR